MSKQLKRASGLYTEHGLNGRLKVDDILENVFRELKEIGYTKKQAIALMTDSFYNPSATSDQVKAARAKKRTVD